MVGEGRHHHRASTAPRLLMALSQKGAATPKPAITPPPSAGPMARLILKPTLFAEIAEERPPLGTSCGSIACQPARAAGRYLCGVGTGTTYSGNFVDGAPCTIV